MRNKNESDGPVDPGMALLERIAVAVECLAAGYGHVPKHLAESAKESASEQPAQTESQS